MIIPKRNQALLFIILVMIGVILLGLSLPDLELKVGLPIPGADPDFPHPEPIESKPGSETTLELVQYGLAFGILLLFMTLIIALLKKVNLKRFGLLVGTLMLLFILFSQLPNPITHQSQSKPVNQNLAPSSFVYEIAPIGEPPASLMVWVVSSLVLACLALICWLIFQAFHQTEKEEVLASEAEMAIQAIANGQSLRDVIIQCYLRMENVISEEQGIERDQSVTPREFEIYLIGKGIPRSPILLLTSLFEKARYGNKSLNNQDEQDALNCFYAIRKACQSFTRGIR